TLGQCSRTYAIRAQRRSPEWAVAYVSSGQPLGNTSTEGGDSDGQKSEPERVPSAHSSPCMCSSSRFWRHITCSTYAMYAIALHGAYRVRAMPQPLSMHIIGPERIGVGTSY